VFPVAATGKNRSCNRTGTGFFETAGSSFGSCSPVPVPVFAYGENKKTYGKPVETGFPYVILNLILHINVTKVHTQDPNDTS
jgi:hypothetical protein